MARKKPAACYANQSGTAGHYHKLKSGKHEAELQARRLTMRNLELEKENKELKDDNQNKCEEAKKLVSTLVRMKKEKQDKTGV